MGRQRRRAGRRRSKAMNQVWLLMAIPAAVALATAELTAEPAVLEVGVTHPLGEFIQGLSGRSSNVQRAKASKRGSGKEEIDVTPRLKALQTEREDATMRIAKATAPQSPTERARANEAWAKRAIATARAKNKEKDTAKKARLVRARELSAKLKVEREMAHKSEEKEALKQAAQEGRSLAEAKEAPHLAGPLV